MERTYTCSQCPKSFKKKDYRAKHVNNHTFFTCDICKRKIREGSRPVHLMRCKPETEAQKTVKKLHQKRLELELLYGRYWDCYWLTVSADSGMNFDLLKSTVLDWTEERENLKTVLDQKQYREKKIEKRQMKEQLETSKRRTIDAHEHGMTC